MPAAILLSESSPEPAPAAPPESSQILSADAPEIYELLSFVVRGNANHLTTDVLRRRFVERFLLSRLPVQSMADVERVDTSPGTFAETLVLRVWCRLKPLA
jgi:hypothetical protein